MPSQLQPSMSGSTFPSLGKTPGRVGQPLCAAESRLCFPCTCSGSLVWGGEEICWGFLMSCECFTSILAGCTTRCGIVTTCPLAGASESLRLQNRTSQAGGPERLAPTSWRPAQQPQFSSLENICQSQANPSNFCPCLLPLLASCSLCTSLFIHR